MKRSIACFGILATLCSAARAQPLVLDFQCDRDGKTKPLTLILSDRVAASSEGSERVVRDFRRAREVRLKGQVGSEMSLYADVAFREAELQNRAMLHGMLEGAKLKQNPFNPVMAEQLFSMSIPGSHQAPTIGSGPGVEVHLGSKLLVQASKDGWAPTPDQERYFLRWMRCALGGHPLALKQLAAQGRIPHRLVVRQEEANQVHVTTLILQGHHLGGAEPTLPTGYTPEPAHSTLDTLLQRASRLDPSTQSEVGMAAERKLLAEHKALPACLAFFENFLSAGNGHAGELSAHKDVWTADPSCTRFIQAMGIPQDSKAFDILHTLEGAAGEQLFVLQVFEGGDLAKSNPPRATELYLKALAHQPRLVGAWKDLGDLEYRRFRIPTAWNCWDTARRLCPGHPILAEIRQREEHLRSAHPEFF